MFVVVCCCYCRYVCCCYCCLLMIVVCCYCCLFLLVVCGYYFLVLFVVVRCILLLLPVFCFLLWMLLESRASCDAHSWCGWGPGGGDCPCGGFSFVCFLLFLLFIFCFLLFCGQFRDTQQMRNCPCPRPCSYFVRSEA